MGLAAERQQRWGARCACPLTAPSLLCPCAICQLSSLVFLRLPMRCDNAWPWHQGMHPTLRRPATHPRNLWHAGADRGRSPGGGDSLRGRSSSTCSRGSPPRSASRSRYVAKPRDSGFATTKSSGNLLDMSARQPLGKWFLARWAGWPGQRRARGVHGAAGLPCPTGIHLPLSCQAAAHLVLLSGACPPSVALALARPQPLRAPPSCTQRISVLQRPD
jgi:hypothetical protein